MKEHALPQDVTGYKFHIIGNMTLKQFAEVATGVGIGFIIYFTNLPDLVKWPLILIFSGIGALTAFVPFEERPLDHWMVSLFKALYRPTQFSWKRMSKIPEPFLYQPKTDADKMAKEVDLTPARRQRVKEYLHSVEQEPQVDPIEEYQNQRLNEIMGVFEQTTSFPVQDEVIQHSLPAIQTEVPPAPISEQVITSQIQQGDQAEVSFKSAVPQPHTNDFSAVQVAQGLGSSGVNIQTSKDLPEVFAKNGPTTIVNTNVSVPQTAEISITPTVTEDLAARTSPQDANQIGDTYMVSQGGMTNQAVTATQTVVQDKSLPFPAKPTQPNKLVGMSIDRNNVPISNVIIEILTETGVPARAVKTNILGQFFITTPLANGVYTISAEKAGYTFPPQRLELNGQVMDPIEIRSS